MEGPWRCQFCGSKGAIGSVVIRRYWPSDPTPHYLHEHCAPGYSRLSLMAELMYEIALEGNVMIM